MLFVFWLQVGRGCRHRHGERRRIKSRPSVRRNDPALVLPHRRRQVSIYLFLQHTNSPLFTRGLKFIHHQKVIHWHIKSSFHAHRDPAKTILLFPQLYCIHNFYSQSQNTLIASIRPRSL
jgi:hypothetical protein